MVIGFFIRENTLFLHHVIYDKCTVGNYCTCNRSHAIWSG